MGANWFILSTTTDQPVWREEYVFTTKESIVSCIFVNGNSFLELDIYDLKIYGAKVAKFVDKVKEKLDAVISSRLLELDIFFWISTGFGQIVCHVQCSLCTRHSTNNRSRLPQPPAPQHSHPVPQFSQLNDCSDNQTQYSGTKESETLRIIQ